MTYYFVDTSALIRRYVNEIGTAWVRSWCHPKAKNAIFISDVTSVEMFSVLARLQRETKLSVTRQTQLETLFLQHLVSQYFKVPVEARLLVDARLLVKAHALRALDALQLASALRVQSRLHLQMMFITSDKQLLSAATSEGFNVDDPNLHP